MESVKKKLDGMQDILGTVLSFSVILMVLVISYTVVMRYIFKNTPDWGFEVSIFIFGIYSILSGAYCLKEKAHVRVDILPSLLSERKQKYIDLLSTILTLVVSVALLFTGTKFAWQSTQILERSIHQSTFNPQIWWFKWMIPISAFFILLQAIVDLGELIAFFKGGKKA